MAVRVGTPHGLRVFISSILLQYLGFAELKGSWKPSLWSSLNSFGCTVDKRLQLDNNENCFQHHVCCPVLLSFLVSLVVCDIKAARRKMSYQESKEGLPWGRPFLTCNFLMGNNGWLMNGEVICLLTLKSSAWLKWMDGWMKLMSLRGHGPAALQYMARTQCKIWPIICLQIAWM